MWNHLLLSLATLSLATTQFLGLLHVKKRKFLSNDKINDCTADSKGQESMQLSITSENWRQIGKWQNT